MRSFASIVHGLMAEGYKNRGARCKNLRWSISHQSPGKRACKIEKDLRAGAIAAEEGKLRQLRTTQQNAGLKCLLDFASLRGRQHVAKIGSEVARLAVLRGEYGRA